MIAYKPTKNILDSFQFSVRNDFKLQSIRNTSAWFAAKKTQTIR